MEELIKSISQFLGDHAVIYKILGSLLVAIILILLRRFVLFILSKRITDVKSSYSWAKGVSYFSYFLFILVVAPIWFRELHSFGTFLGLLSAGLAVALKDPISNLFAWIYIVFRKPFEMGDRIQIDQSEGDILDIGFFEFTLLEIKNWVKADQSTGRIIHIPNGLLFTKPVVNYNQAMNFIWNEIPVIITFESDWQKTKKILLEIEKKKLKGLVKGAETEFSEAKRKFHVSYTNLEPAVYTNIVDFGVQLTLRYLCHPRKRRDSVQLAIEAILIEFEKHDDIHLAYPTTRFYDATKE